MKHIKSFLNSLVESYNAKVDIKWVDKSDRLTNFNSGKMSILSAIGDGMNYLIEKKSPNCLIFASLDSSECRKKLYFRYSKEIESEFGFTLNTALFGDKEVFILYRNEINVDDIDKVVQFNQ